MGNTLILVINLDNSIKRCYLCANKIITKMKDERIVIKSTKDFKLKIKELASRKGLTVSAYITMMLTELLDE